MKQLPMRRFTTVAAFLSEPVQITRYDGEEDVVIGVYTPIEKFNLEGGGMDEPVKKEIQREAPKPVGRGKLSKGLGEVPGVTDDSEYKYIQPWPKPSKRQK